MANEEYEMIPEGLLADLKHDVEALKKKLSQPDNKIQELILEIESLKDSIHELNSIFHKALEESKDEDSGKVLAIVKEKMEAVVSQNETIAKGMIAISDKLEDWMKKTSPGLGVPPGMEAPPLPPQHAMRSQHEMGSPIGGAPARSAPMPEMPAAPPIDDSNDLPPPPPTGGKKRGGVFR